jgi:hypothetical protein
MAEDELVDPAYEGGWVEGLEWLTNLSDNELKLLGRVVLWVRGVCNDTLVFAAGHNLDQDDKVFVRQWDLSGCAHRYKSVITPRGVSFEMWDTLRRTLMFYAESRIAPSPEWSGALEKPFNLVRRFLKLCAGSSELRDFLEHSEAWEGSLEDLEMVARQLLR